MKSALRILLLSTFRVSSINYFLVCSLPIHRRSSTNAEGPWAHCQLKSCKMLHKCSTDCIWKGLQPVNAISHHADAWPAQFLVLMTLVANKATYNTVLPTSIPIVDYLDRLRGPPLSSTECIDRYNRTSSITDWMTCTVDIDYNEWPSIVSRSSFSLTNTFLSSLHALTTGNKSVAY